MRIISQFGVDFPYEHIIVLREENNICGELSSAPDEHYLLAKYSSEEKAVEVLGDMRNAYRNEQTAFYFPDEDEVKV